MSKLQLNYEFLWRLKWWISSSASQLWAKSVILLDWVPPPFRSEGSLKRFTTLSTTVRSSSVALGMQGGLQDMRGWLCLSCKHREHDIDLIWSCAPASPNQHQQTAQDSPSDVFLSTASGRVRRGVSAQSLLLIALRPNYIVLFLLSADTLLCVI